MGPTVRDYLKYCPVGVVKSPYGVSSGKTSIPANPRGLENVEISVWDSFIQDYVSPECAAALKWQSEQELRPLYEEEEMVVACETEAQVERMLDKRLFEPLTRLMRYLGAAGDFSPRPISATLDPDYAWRSEMVKSTIEVGSPRTATPSLSIAVVKIVIEVKTFWAFDPPDDLVAILKSEMSQAEESRPHPQKKKTRLKKKKRRLNRDDERSMGEKVARAVSQIYGYMSIDHLQYGVLATFDKFFFLHRLDTGGPSGPSKLEITRVIRRDQTRDSAGCTLMEAWLGLVKAAERDHVLTSPYSSPNVKKVRLKIEDPMMLFTTAKLANLYFGERRTRSQLGTVVQGGIWGEDEKICVMKIIDASKSSKNAGKLDIEISAYRKLVDLQGTVVPKVRGFLLIHGWIKVLVLSNCGERITGKQFVEHDTEIRSMVKQIHSAGVTHGDLAYRNILVDTKEKLTIIDFSEAKLKKDCRGKEFEDRCRQDFDDLNSLQ